MFDNYFLETNNKINWEKIISACNLNTFKKRAEFKQWLNTTEIDGVFLSIFLEKLGNKNFGTRQLQIKKLFIEFLTFTNPYIKQGASLGLVNLIKNINDGKEIIALLFKLIPKEKSKFVKTTFKYVISQIETNLKCHK